MRAPALAIAWEFRRQHRWGLVAVVGYVPFLVAFKLLILGPEGTVDLVPIDDLPSPAVVVPFALLFGYLLAVFSFGFAGDLAARQSTYPARMFALPVTTGALAGWPMLYGTMAMASLLLATALMARSLWRLDAPLIWPAVYAATFLAWTQVLAWMPYGWRGFRVVAAVLWLTTINIVVLGALYYEVPEPVMVALLAPQLPLAYLCARFAVARARRGDLPDWRTLFGRLGRIVNPVARRPDHFSSPARAQRWFEWRRHGRALPVWVGILLPFELALLLVPGNDTPTLVFYTLFVALLTPPFMAAFAAARVPTSRHVESTPYGVTPFIATRPLTSATLVVAKLTMAFWSTLAAWLLVLVAVPLGLTLSDTWPVVIDWANQAVEIFGAPRALVIALLGFLGLVAATWKQLVQGLSIGLTGREWLVRSSVFLRLSLLIVILAVAEYVLDNRLLALLWDASAWILAAMVVVKMSAAAWVATRLARDRLLSDRVLVTGAVCWLVAVLALYALLEWILSLPLSMSRYHLALVAILAIPLTRPSTAPLALAWNRHRGAAASSPIFVKPRRRVAVGVLALLGVPLLLAVAEVASYAVVDLTDGAIVASYEERDNLLYVPAGYDRTTPTPLVLSMHGAGSYPAQHMNMSGWNRVADEEGVIVVYPSGAGFPRVFEAQNPGPDLAAESAFFSGLIDTVTAAYNIDASRIYANGLSNGGGMSFALSCTLSDRIAAVGVVAPALFLPWSWCTDQRAVPMMAFHGTADRLTPYHGGRSWVDTRQTFPDIPTWVAGWAQRNRCAPTPVDAEVAPDVVRRSYGDCADQADVVFYTIQGGGHTWPGGEPMPEWLAGTTTGSIDATRQLWAFYREHPMPSE